MENNMLGMEQLPPVSSPTIERGRKIMLSYYGSNSCEERATATRKCSCKWKEERSALLVPTKID